MACDQTKWTIHEGELDRADVHALLAEHLAFANASSPAEAVNTLGIAELRDPGVRFFTLREGDALLGFAALHALESGHGEVKSMRTATAARRRGVARAMLDHLLAEARAMGWRRISLETGTGEPFVAANALYLSMGFERCGPFAQYLDHPATHFYTRDL